MTLLATILAALSYIWADGYEMRVGPEGPWQRIASLSEIPQVNDEVWIRTNVDLTNLRRVPGRPVAIYFGGMASHELYWDGILLGRGGVVARTKEGETPGPIESHYQIPDHLATPRTHSVVVRMSAFHRGFSPVHGYWGVLVTDYDSMLETRTWSAHFAMIAMSGIVLTGVFAFALFWLTRRDRSFLLLGTLCLAAAALLLAEAWRSLFGYTYDWHIVRMRAVVVLSWLIGVQLVALLVTRFPHRSGRAAMLATAIIAAVLPWVPAGWDQKSLYIFLFCGSVAVAWAVFAATRRMHGSVLALIGTGVALVALLLNPWSWVDNLLYFALNFLFLCLLCSHALEVRREQQEKARLQLEIVRRHMQPHFLMNTLTALSEWIEQEPKTAVRMIESLSEELRMLGEMSTRTFVTADDELRLCRSHLANMSLRRDVEYALEVEGVDGSRLVPPAIFHTLVENAITHGEGERVVMKLTAHTEGGRTRYTFDSTRGEGRGARGEGTKYIEARLREAWGNAWSFRQGPFGELWRAEIEVPA
jgi:hypothetical protein